MRDTRESSDALRRSIPALVTLERERLELRPLLEGALATLRDQAARRSVELQLETSEEPVYVEADRERLARVLKSVVTCVVDQTAPGGLVAVRTRVERDRLKIEIESMRPLDWPAVRMGRPEVRASPKVGFVLHAASALLRQHDGWLSAQLFQAFGTVVAISLPGVSEPRDS